MHTTQPHQHAKSDSLQHDEHRTADHGFVPEAPCPVSPSPAERTACWHRIVSVELALLHSPGQGIHSYALPPLLPHEQWRAGSPAAEHFRFYWLCCINHYLEIRFLGYRLFADQLVTQSSQRCSIEPPSTARLPGNCKRSSSCRFAGCQRRQRLLPAPSTLYPARLSAP